MKYKAYFGIKYHEDNRNKDEIDSLAAVLNNDGIETICITRDVEKWGNVQLSSQELMKITFEEIDKSDFVVLEMSEKGVGLGIEAGYAAAKGKPLIVLIKEEQKLSDTMQGIADVVIPYNQPEEIAISAHNKTLQRSRTSRTADL
jgi:nucleoside 2-deoxyribosyltransferase